MRIAVLVTCFNRVDVTLRGIDSLVRSLNACAELDYKIFLVDDGSSDGTGVQVKRLFPFVEVSVGSGELYWSGGMTRAFRAASAHAPFDAYLLFNDDVDLFEVEIPRFHTTYQRLNEAHPSILVGACVDLRGNVTYAGFRLGSPLRVLDFKRVEPVDSPVPCDTFNANFVLIPGRFFEEVGGLDPAYSHSYADIDLGLVAGKLGVPSFVYELPVGVCEKTFR